MDARRNMLQPTYEKLLEAEDLRRAGDLENAGLIARQLADEYPDYWGAQHTLGVIHFDRAEFDQAYDRLARATLLSPDNPLTLAIFARTCLELRAFSLSQRMLDAAIGIAPDNPHVLFAHGEFFRCEDEFERAAEFYRRAIAADQDHQQARTALAACLRELGMLTEAARMLEAQLTLRTLEPLYELSSLPAAITRVDIIAEIGKLAPPPPHKTPEHRITTAFIRAITLHGRGRFADAWAQLLVANQLAIAGREAELEEQRSYERATLEAAQSAAGRYRPRKAEPDRPTSLLILGPSRSGKSTLERLLATLDGVHPCFESRIFGDAVQFSFQDAGLLARRTLELLPPELHEGCRERYFVALREKNPSARVFSNTMPGLVSDAVRIAAVIPNVRFILVRRRLEDTLLRIFMKWYKSGNVYSYDLHAARRHIFWYNEMMDILAVAFPDITLQIRYEDMIEKPAEVRAAAARLIRLDAPSRPALSLVDDRDCAAPYRSLLAARNNSDASRLDSTHSRV
jgi:tetratricopeptide (TPR) repeat protein